ncbi:MAG: S8 family serine peptidase [Candidatus Poseidoniaceae archaeon]|nr:S8 family serine peptidase [Candidatus Poseidoniaceae archaeon]|tara:strand:+ start:217 stop:2403 length:2187 start_codon:yes stop_codon:yes gene_type:complete
MRRLLALFLFAVMMGPVTGSLTVGDFDGRNDWSSVEADGLQWIHSSQTFEVPQQTPPQWVDDDTPWWERTTLDLDRNEIHDSLESMIGVTGIGLVYQTDVTESHLNALQELGLTVVDVIEAVDGVLLGQVNTSLAPTLAALDDVVMVERYGNVIFYGDVQTPAVKASNSSFYPVGAWDLGVSGAGVNIAMVDTGVDNEHPGLSEKFVAGYDAVCYLTSDPTCYLDISRRTDGTYDPDDGNQHGTACMGMAAATGIDSSGAQTEFYGAAPNAALVDVRIGTDAGAGPFENYILEQEFYESAMNGVQWIIDNKDTAWEGADGTNYGIDILSLSWGITSHEGGGSDGNDMHSQILNEAMEAGIIVSVAAGNDGPDNDGLSGMGSSDLSLTVGATDDLNTVNREDDTIAGYSSRGPRADNGDGNPLNELKPEISAPGSNIIQAEGCVTSGLCNNLLGGDAADNGYTGRGSGTSYATPSVSGIIALMLEANPDLSPAEIKEIIKLTAERRGEATQPDVDPFWNRDFGWGMADAYEATKMAFLLKEQNLTGAVDVFTQVHIVNSSNDENSGLYVIEGMAWSQASVVSAVEYRIGNGAWKSASFEDGGSELAALQRFTWTLAFDLGTLEKGNQTIEIRGLNDAGVQSLPVSVMVMGSGDASSTDEGFPLSLSLGGIVVVFMLLATLLNTRIQEPLSLLPVDSEASIEAVIESDAEMADAIDAILVEGAVVEKKGN